MTTPDHMANLPSILRNIFAPKFDHDDRHDIILIQNIFNNEADLVLRLPSLPFWIQMLTVS